MKEGCLKSGEMDESERNFEVFHADEYFKSWSKNEFKKAMSWSKQKISRNLNGAFLYKLQRKMFTHVKCFCRV